MADAQRDWYGDALAEGELDPWFWASKLHFYIAGISFYNFPYTFGYLFSLGLFGRAKAEGPAFLPRVEELLRLAGSDTAPRAGAPLPRRRPRAARLLARLDRRRRGRPRALRGRARAHERDAPDTAR